MARPRLTREQESQVRKAACDAVFTTLARDGYDAVSLRQVARATGLTPMGLYRYFPDGRDEIIAVARTRGHEQLLERLQIAAASTREPGERLRRLAHAFVAFGIECPAEFTLVFRVPGGDWEHRELAEAGERTAEFVFQVAAECIEAMGIEGEPRQLVRLVYAALLGVLALEYAGRTAGEDLYAYFVDPMLERLLGLDAAPA